MENRTSFQLCNRYVGTAVRLYRFFFLFFFFFKACFYFQTLQHVRSRHYHVLKPPAKETHVRLATSEAAWSNIEFTHITLYSRQSLKEIQEH